MSSDIAYAPLFGVFGQHQERVPMFFSQSVDCWYA